jgi:hypothetical protein
MFLNTLLDASIDPSDHRARLPAVHDASTQTRALGRSASVTAMAAGIALPARQECPHPIAGLIPRALGLV